jgi:selenophosphate synthetase-related protein
VTNFGKIGLLIGVCGSLYSLFSNVVDTDSSKFSTQAPTVVISFVDESDFELTSDYKTLRGMAAGEITNRGKDLRISGWIKSSDGAIIVYSAGSSLTGQYFRMKALPRPDVVNYKKGDTSFLNTGFDFLFGKKEVGSVKCITFQEENTISVLWETIAGSCGE